MNTLAKIIALLIIIIGICISVALILIALNISTLTQSEIELVLLMTNLIILELKIFIPICILIPCLSIMWCLLPKKTDDPLIRLVKTTGFAGGLFIALIITLLIYR